MVGQNEYLQVEKLSFLFFVNFLVTPRLIRNLCLLISPMLRYILTTRVLKLCDQMIKNISVPIKVGVALDLLNFILS